MFSWQITTITSTEIIANVKKLIKRQKHNKISLTLKLEANFKYE